MNKQGFKFEIKSVTDEGSFEGALSVYGVVDLGNESVEKGAFTKSIKERGNEVPLLWQHDAKQPIGMLELIDTSEALLVKGRLVLEVERAREAHALMKAGALKGLSIGYDTVKSVMEAGVRKLKELRLWEGSLVTFPMLPIAQVDLASVKHVEEAKDYESSLANIQTWAMRYQSISALDSALDHLLFAEMSVAEKTIQVSQTIDQFRETYLDFLPRWDAMLESYKSLDDLVEQKAGRRISSQTRSEIETVITQLQALLAEPAGDEPTEEAEAAKQKDQEPEVLHSWLSELKNEIQGELQCKN